MMLTIITRLIGGIFSYRNIRSWSWKRKYYKKSRPLIAFTPEGNPIAVLPCDQDLVYRNASRLSVDSLLQRSEHSLDITVGYNTSSDIQFNVGSVML